jgi:maltose alpha-D-glucosyltransferase/alpha-amylase
MNTTPPPRWYQEAVIYEVHVRAFADGNGDGIGDLAGLIAPRLPAGSRRHRALAPAVLPVAAARRRLRHRRLHRRPPGYGTLADFERSSRGPRPRPAVITELVINHTSREHPWFQARAAGRPAAPARDSTCGATRRSLRDARIIFKDFEPSNWTWDPVAKAYYWHRFYAHQPDLNFDNPAVHEALVDAIDFWLDLGVDGLRLDAVPYLYEREGTSCENLPETHAS